MEKLNQDVGIKMSGVIVKVKGTAIAVIVKENSKSIQL